MAKKSVAKQSAKKRTPNVHVKQGGEVVSTVQNFLVHNLHQRFNFRLAASTQKTLVAYGPWLAILLVVILLPELLVLAKDSRLIGFTGFFDTIFFNQQSWVILLVLLANVMLLVDGLGDLFHKAKKGWDRIYFASLISAVYIIWQLLGNLSQPAAPLLSLLGIFAILFALLDIREYYK